MQDNRRGAPFTRTGAVTVATFWDPEEKKFFTSTVPQHRDDSYGRKDVMIRDYSKAPIWAAQSEGYRHAGGASILYAEDGAYYNWEERGRTKYPVGSIVASCGGSSDTYELPACTHRPPPQGRAATAQSTVGCDTVAQALGVSTSLSLGVSGGAFNRAFLRGLKEERQRFLLLPVEEQQRLRLLEKDSRAFPDRTTLPRLPIRPAPQAPTKKLPTEAPPVPPSNQQEAVQQSQQREQERQQIASQARKSPTQNAPLDSSSSPTSGSSSDGGPSASFHQTRQKINAAAPSRQSSSSSASRPSSPSNSLSPIVRVMTTDAQPAA
ncbi:hypothetical protein C1H76_2841 [Elsinoe australis]|uniref:Uncharacterized protein n=1 Tax=Elsinoe australis TaxID=40998 RepID=A0A4U7B140_9PEZI|nr:hypothetical protein C1H76_2841 [Elsinoe australis]